MIILSYTILGNNVLPVGLCTILIAGEFISREYIDGIGLRGPVIDVPVGIGFRGNISFPVKYRHLLEGLGNSIVSVHKDLGLMS